jgi:hypothetical protein
VLLVRIHRALDARGVSQDQIALSRVDPDPDLAAGRVAVSGAAFVGEAALDETRINPELGQVRQPMAAESK